MVQGTRNKYHRKTKEIRGRGICETTAENRKGVDTLGRTNSVQIHRKYTRNVQIPV